MLRKIVRSLPGLRGKQRLLILLDKWFGPSKLVGRRNIVFEGFSSSVQDLAFLRPTTENPLLENFIAELPKDGVFLDCGANCGFYSALAAKHFDKHGMVISIEPSPREYRRLLYAVANNSHQCRWITVNSAATESSQLLPIDCGFGHTGMNRIATTSDSPNVSWTLGLRLDDLLTTILDDRHVDFLKIDVEGFEANVLRGLQDSLKSKRFNRIMVEITDSLLKQNGDTKEELYKSVTKNGYSSTVNSDDWQYDELFVLK